MLLSMFQETVLRAFMKQESIFHCTVNCEGVLGGYIGIIITDMWSDKIKNGFRLS